MGCGSARASRLLALVAVGGLAVCACSGPDQSPPTRTSTQQTSASSTAPTSQAPTPEVLAEAAALQTLSDYWDVYQDYQQAPAAQDWEPVIRRYADDSATAVDLSIIRTLLQDGLRQEGRYEITSRLSDLDLAADPQPIAVINACFDSTGARAVYAATGEPTDNPPPAIPRWELRITLLQYLDRTGTPWLVHDFEPLTDQPC